MWMKMKMKLMSGVQCGTEECEKWYHICVNSNWPDKQVDDVNEIWHCCS